MVEFSALSPLLFALTSLVAGGLNAVFLARTVRNYRAVQILQSTDRVLGRISRGFILVWVFIILTDTVRVAAGVGVMLHQPDVLLLLLFNPIGSISVAIIGLRSFR